MRAGNKPISALRNRYDEFTMAELAADKVELRAPPVLREVLDRFGEGALTIQPTRDGIPTVWSDAERVRELLWFLKHEAAPPYRMLLDLTVVDERLRMN